VSSRSRLEEEEEASGRMPQTQTVAVDGLASPDVAGEICSSSQCGANFGIGKRANHDPKLKPRVSTSRRQHNQSKQHSMLKPQTLFDNFHNELTSLRDATKKCLEYFYNDRGRRCAEIDKMDSRSAYVRQMIGLEQCNHLSNEKAIGELPLINSTAGVEDNTSIVLDESLDDATENTPKSTSPPQDGWMSFIDGVSDGMPSRWRRRVLERSKRDAHNNKVDDKLQNKYRQDDLNLEDKLRDRIVERKREILALEKRLAIGDQEIYSLRGEITDFQDKLQNSHRKFERERTELLDRCKKVEFNNENLDRMLIETEVSLEEKHISTNFLANELKRVRKDLENVLNDKDWRKSERRRKGFFIGSDGRSNAHQINAAIQKEGRMQQKPLYDDPDVNMQQLQVPPDDDGDTSRGNSVHGIHDCGGAQDLNLSPSQSSVRTGISSVTRDSCTFIDILEQLERRNRF
jgi:hypothetical protein